MAKDLALKHLCPHYVRREWVTLGPTGTTLRPRVTSSNTHVTLHYNNVVIPPEGLHTHAKICTKHKGPYHIKHAVNDELRLALNGGPVQSYYLPTGSNVSSETLVSYFNAITGLRASISRGYLVLETTQTSTQSSIFLYQATANAVLGLPEARFYRGATIQPAWNFVQPEANNPYRLIQFEDFVRSREGVWEISYFTRRQDCRRCNGIGIEYDMRWDAQGEPIYLTGIDLLAQEVEKIVFTVKGSNVFYYWYGTSINELIGSKILQGGSYLESQLISEISTTLEKFRSVKQQQASLQEVSDAEYFHRLNELQVTQDADDPTVFRIRIAIQNREGRVSELSRTIFTSTRRLG